MLPINRFTYHLAGEKENLDYIGEYYQGCSYDENVKVSYNTVEYSSPILICRTVFDIKLLDGTSENVVRLAIYKYVDIVEDMATKLRGEHSRDKLAKFLDELKAITLPSIEYYSWCRYFSRAILREHVQLIHETTARIQLLDEQSECMWATLFDRKSNVSILVPDVIELIVGKLQVGRVKCAINYVRVTTC